MLISAVNVQQHLDLMADLTFRGLLFIEGKDAVQGQELNWLDEISWLIFVLVFQA